MTVPICCEWETSSFGSLELHPTYMRLHRVFETHAEYVKIVFAVVCGARYKTRPGLTYHLSHSHNKPPPPDDECEPPMPSPKVASAAASASTHDGQCLCVCVCDSTIAQQCRLACITTKREAGCFVKSFCDLGDFVVVVVMVLRRFCACASS
jgi:hypothetical protein